MSVRYTRRAFADREAIFDYLEQRNPNAAISVKRSLVKAIQALGIFPRLGQCTEIADVYELVVPRYPYKVYYRIEGNDFCCFTSAMHAASLGSPRNRLAYTISLYTRIHFALHSFRQ